jgi:hypothetical protein
MTAAATNPPEHQRQPAADSHNQDNSTHPPNTHERSRLSDLERSDSALMADGKTAQLGIRRSGAVGARLASSPAGTLASISELTLRTARDLSSRTRIRSPSGFGRLVTWRTVK